MFGLFKSPPFRDPLLGQFTRSRGHWRGALSLEGAMNVPLVLSGTRTEPDAQAVAIAQTMESAFAYWRPAIASALFEHYGPYAEAVAEGEFPGASKPLPNINAPDEVWPHVALAFVSVAPIEGAFISEFGFTTAWDEEHTLGVRFQEGKFIELCGSVLPP